MKKVAPFLAPVLVLACSVTWAFGLLLAMNGMSESQGTLALTGYGGVAIAAIAAAFAIAWRVCARATTGGNAVLRALLIAAIACVALVVVSACIVAATAGTSAR